MTTAIHNLITIRAVSTQIQSFCNNTGVGILVSLTTSINTGLQKKYQNLSTNQKISVHTRPSSKYNISKAVMIAPLVSSKLETNIRCNWDNRPSFSANSRNIEPISCQHTFESVKIGGEIDKRFSQMFWNIDNKLYVTKQCC